MSNVIGLREDIRKKVSEMIRLLETLATYYSQQYGYSYSELDTLIKDIMYQAYAFADFDLRTIFSLTQKEQQDLLKIFTTLRKK